MPDCKWSSNLFKLPKRIFDTSPERRITPEHSNTDAVFIGITGHRNLPPEQLSAITRSLDTCLLFIREQITARHVHSVAAGQMESPAPCLISLLAEGADRIAAHSAITNGYGLYSILPFPRDIYVNDFFTVNSKKEFDYLLQQSISILEFPGSTTDASASYLHAGKEMLQKSKILLTVWDGKDVVKPGGTASIVAIAKQMNLPVIHITPEHPGEIVFLYNNASTSDWKSALRTFFKNH